MALAQMPYTDSPDTECTVTVTATDSAGVASTAATVTINITNVDEKPTFSSGYMMASITEGTTVVDLKADDDNADTGESVYTAMDPDGLRVNLSLMGPDAAKFSLSSGRSLSFVMKPDYENPTDANGNNVYEVTVRASDGTMYADRMVKITVTEDNEAPEIMGRDSVEYAENGEGAVATFTATDPEGATPITWSLAASESDPDGDAGPLVTADAADADDFDISKDGVLTFDIGGDTENPDNSVSPDFEAPRAAAFDAANNTNTYRVVVVAADAETGGEMGYHKVTVKVTNVAETGKVTWTIDPDGTAGALNPTNVNGGSPIVQFQVGAALTASVTDGDVGGADKTPTENLRWQWHRGNTPITTNGNAATYNVITEDIGSRLRVTALYNVDGGRDESASRTSDHPVLDSRTSNDEPEFDPSTITREVSEGKKGMTVGAPVTATDDITNALSYSLAGEDERQIRDRHEDRPDKDLGGPEIAKGRSISNCERLLALVQGPIQAVQILNVQLLSRPRTPPVVSPRQPPSRSRSRTLTRSRRSPADT